MAKLPENIREMTKWPNTPSQARITTALNLHETRVDSNALFLTIDADDMNSKDAKKIMDAAMDGTEVQTILDEDNWQRWAVETYQSELAEREDNSENRLSLMASIAAEADGEDTMGLVILSRKTQNAGESGQMAMGFARMFRREEWMGFCQMLKETSGLAAIVVESRKNPGRMGHTICMPMDLMVEENPELPPDQDLPLPGGKELKKILRWHGVKSILWNPVSED